MASRALTDIFILMRNNSLQSRQVYNEQISDLQSDRVALIRKKPLIVEQDVELGAIEDDDEDGADNGDISNRLAPPPPPWIDDLLDIRHNSTLIGERMKELDKLQNKHVQRPTFDDDSSTEREIEEITHEITRLFGTCHRLVSQMKDKGHRSSYNERRLRDNVVKSVVSALQEQSQHFRSSQGTYLRKITDREKMSSQYFDLPPEANPSPYNYDEIFLESDPSKPQEWTQQQLLSLEEDNLVLAEREHEVQEIVKSILDLNTIFRELATMVTEQGALVDRIDYNVENTYVKVEEGVKHLQKAATYQKRNRKCVCIVSVIFITILAIILLLAFGT